MTGRLMRIVIIFFALFLIFVGGWSLMYPSSSDPKNIKYVLWKAGFYKANLDDATGAMVGDPDRDKLVVGKTRAELRDRFGLLRSPAEASPYLRGCYENSPWNKRDVVFIGQSLRMVVLDGDKATNMVLIKGC